METGEKRWHCSIKETTVRARNQCRLFRRKGIEKKPEAGEKAGLYQIGNAGVRLGEEKGITLFCIGNTGVGIEDEKGITLFSIGKASVGLETEEGIRPYHIGDR